MICIRCFLPLGHNEFILFLDVHITDQYSGDLLAVNSAKYYFPTVLFIFFYLCHITWFYNR